MAINRSGAWLIIILILIIILAILAWLYGQNDDPEPQAGKTVFVTSSTFSGNLGGLGGADAQCMALAQNVILNEVKDLSKTGRLSYLERFQ